MDFAEISTVFSDNQVMSMGIQEIQQKIQEQPQHINPQQNTNITCNDYDLHTQYCTTCMYRQAKKRSNIFNIFLILALFYIVLKK